VILVHGEITEQVIAAAFEVHRVLGYGFLEKVYQRAMEVELKQRGLEVQVECSITVMYKGTDVGEYKADLFVAQSVIVTLKVTRDSQPADEPQLLNELHATGVKVGLLINFGRNRVEFKRLGF
jgi:GxxExxY protein